MPARSTLAILALGLLAARAAADEPPQFNRHVTPVLYRLGCSAGSCHGAFAGKGGFRLSLFAGQPEADYRNVRGPLGRRVNPLDPEKSLLLLKPTGAVPHGGGLRLRAGSPEYEVLRAWIAAGARHDPRAEPRVLSLRVEPATLAASIQSAARPLRVLARLSDGREDEVTGFTHFESLDPAVAVVDRAGRVSGIHSGSVPVLAHYAGQVGFASVLVPGTLPPGMKFPEEKLADPIDLLLAGKLKQLNILPSPLCKDEEFLRRTSLDVTGLLPEPDAVQVPGRPGSEQAAKVD